MQQQKDMLSFCAFQDAINRARDYTFAEENPFRLSPWRDFTMSTLGAETLWYWGEVTDPLAEALRLIREGKATPKSGGCLLGTLPRYG